MNKLLISILIAFCVACGPGPEPAEMMTFRNHPNHDCRATPENERLAETIPGLCVPLESEKHKRFAECTYVPKGVDVTKWQNTSSGSGANLHAHEDGSLHFGFIEPRSPATTTGPCSPANTGDGNTITMDCDEDKP